MPTTASSPESSAEFIPRTATVYGHSVKRERGGIVLLTVNTDRGSAVLSFPPEMAADVGTGLRLKAVHVVGEHAPNLTEQAAAGAPLLRPSGS